MLNQPAQTGDLSTEISRLVNDGRERFLQVGALLRSFLDNLPAGEGKLRSLDRALEGTGICRRTATYWMEIDRVYSGIGIPEWELADLGWTKLSIMARRVTPENARFWLTVARKSSVQDLRQRIHGEGEKERIVVLRFRDVEYTNFVKTLLDHGASIHGARNLVNKEAAVLSMCRAAPPALQRREGHVASVSDMPCKVVSIDKHVPVPFLRADRVPGGAADGPDRDGKIRDDAAEPTGKRCR